MAPTSPTAKKQKTATRFSPVQQDGSVLYHRHLTAKHANQVKPVPPVLSLALCAKLGNIHQPKTRQSVHNVIKMLENTLMVQDRSHVGHVI